MTDHEALQVVRLTRELLTPESKWTQVGDFDEQCLINAESFTLSCAIKLMQISVTGKFESRNKLMRRLRSVIRWNFFWRQGWHPIYNFNKHKKTTYREIMFVLDKLEASFS